MLKKPIFLKKSADLLIELPSVIKQYNNTIHQSIKMTPIPSSEKVNEKEVLSTLKNKKSKKNNILIEKYKDMLENPDFEQGFWSKTAEGFYKIGHDSIRIKKWLIYDDRSY